MSKIICPNGEIQPATPQDICEIQFFLDHPSLLEVGRRPIGEDWTRLHHDIVHCRQLLTDSGRQEAELIGAGSYGVVFRCFDEQYRRVVAVKILRPSCYLSARIRSRFSLEAEALAKCALPGIVHVLGAEEIDGEPFIVTEYIDGPNLAQYVHQHDGKLTSRESIELVISIARAIQGMHERGFIHRDLKPTNILLESRDEPGERRLQPIVTDFGFVKEIALDKPNHSVSGETVGTFDYMAPEQALGLTDQISIKTDIHALGAILFELLTGEKPFASQGKCNTLVRLSQETAQSVRVFHPELSRTLAAIVGKCLEKSPDKRYASAAEFANDLESHLENRPTIARPPSLLQKTWRSALENKLLTATWLLLLGSLITIGILYQMLSHLYLSEKSSRLREESHRVLFIEALHDIQSRAEEKWNEPGKMEDRLFLQRLAYEKFEELAEQRNHDAYSRHKLSISCHYLSHAELLVDKRSEALIHRRQGVALLEQLVVEDPKNAKYCFNLFYNTMLLGELLEGAEKIAAYESASQKIESLCVQYPDNADYLDARNSMSLALSRHLLLAKGSIPNRERVEKLIEKAMKSSESLAKQYPDKPDYGRYVSQGHKELGRIAGREGNFKKMKEHFEQALETHQKISQKFNERGDWLGEELSIRISFVRALEESSHFEEMVAELRDCLPAQEKFIKWFPEQASAEWEFAMSKIKLANGLLKLGQREEARKWLDEAREMCANAKTPESVKELAKIVTDLLEETEAALKTAEAKP